MYPSLLSRLKPLLMRKSPLYIFLLLTFSSGVLLAQSTQSPVHDSTLVNTPAATKGAFIPVHAVQAVDPVRSKFTYGFQGGLNLSDITNVSLNDFGQDNFQGKVKTGFNAGIFAQIPLMSFLYLQPEINYSLKGYKGETDQGTFIRNYHIVDVPVVLKIYPVKHLYVYLGPQVSVKVATSISSTNPDATFLIKYDRRDNQLREIVAGATGGIGVDLGRHLMFNAGYARDLNKSYKGNGYDTPGFKNHIFTVRVGYRL